ncbi:hypothetical protein GCM10009715_12140 [Paeniglutamicibacter psychrophenolicus]
MLPIPTADAARLTPVAGSKQRPRQALAPQPPDPRRSQAVGWMHHASQPAHSRATGPAYTPEGKLETCQAPDFLLRNCPD